VAEDRATGREARDVPGSRRVPDSLARRARTHRDHPAVEAPSGTLSYGELESRVASAARALSEAGAEASAPVAVLCGNDLPLCVLAHAVPRAGAVLLPLNARLTAAELGWQLADAGARLLIADEGLRSLAAAAAAEAGAQAAHWPRLLAAEELTSGAAELPAAQPGTSEPLIDLDTVHSAIYTSGTSGRPKAALLTHGNLLASAVGSAFQIGVRAEDRWLAPLPLFHVGGLSILVRSAVAGTTAVVHERFDEAAVSRALREEGVTVASLVPAMLRRLLDHDEALPPYPSSVRAVLIGGASAAPELLARADERGLRVAPTYGLTEAASQVTTLVPGQARRHPGSSGQPLLGVSIAIEVEGRAAAPDEVGEILVAGPTVSPGYLNRSPEERPGGWLRTGDLGALDAEGRLTVADRRDDLVVSGGENVYPAEVEAALGAHPAVLECAVVGLADERWGQAVAAAIVSASGALPAAAELESFLRERLAGYKLPRRFKLWDGPLPRTASGKLLRRVVREQLARDETPPAAR
jgi:O-succinylbenzoic acid--CoA ligase